MAGQVTRTGFSAGAAAQAAHQFLRDCARCVRVSDALEKARRFLERTAELRAARLRFARVLLDLPLPLCKTSLRLRHQADDLVTRGLHGGVGLPSRAHGRHDPQIWGACIRLVSRAEVTAAMHQSSPETTGKASLLSRAIVHSVSPCLACR